MDEDMFFATRMIKLNPGEYLTQGGSIYSVSLGLLPSYANYFFKDQNEIINLLEILSEIK